MSTDRNPDTKPADPAQAESKPKTAREVYTAKAATEARLKIAEPSGLGFVIGAQAVRAKPEPKG
jgi:hypothetical protein